MRTPFIWLLKRWSYKKGTSIVYSLYTVLLYCAKDDWPAFFRQFYLQTENVLNIYQWFGLTECFIRNFTMLKIYMYDTFSKTSFGSFLLLNMFVIFIHCPDSDTEIRTFSKSWCHCILFCLVLFCYFLFLVLGWILTFLHILFKIF